ncbi:hypothetical protein K0M31_012116 [Melipona bicolor]|uniref:Uncharacterized protein n=1 Tax=Melipona bicolor TaxID=60889 RepID=A0AA40KVE8_9HYME|nr:hypothetical protein K0M31_012116 [Melipona bicolor]
MVGGEKKRRKWGKKEREQKKMNRKNGKGDAKEIKRRRKKPPPAEHEASAAGLVPRNITVCSIQVQLPLLPRIYSLPIEEILRLGKSDGATPLTVDRRSALVIVPKDGNASPFLADLIGTTMLVSAHSLIAASHR